MVTMKRLLAAAALVAVVLGVIGCSKPADSDTSTDTSTPQNTATTPGTGE